MSTPRIAHVRAFTVGAGGGADYHDQEGYHWIDDHISTPMSRYPGYDQSRRSFGINVLGTLVVEVEADDGTIGFGVTTAGEPGAWIVEKHLARFLERLGLRLGTRDLDERLLWHDYRAAYEAALERCNTAAAPWYVVPADRKWYRNWAISQLLVEQLEDMDPQWPAADFDVDAARTRLLTEQIG